MSGKTVGILLAGVALGLALQFLVPQQKAEAQRPEKTAPWEYKVVFEPSAAYTERLGGFDTAAAKISGEFNTLAEDGWECLGPIFVHHQPTTVGAFILFKRPKK